jgi:hypothetical protein
VKTETLNFVTELFAKRQLPAYFSTITNTLCDEVIFNNLNISESKVDVMIVEDLPRYLKIGRTKKPKYIKSFLVKHYPGFLIDFNGVKDLSDYLNQRFGKSSRYKLRREQRKLEHCFNISYKMYFGEMSQETYDFIFEEFYKLLAVRSIEKGIENNVNFKYKAQYYERVHQMILNKDASFFVIYNGKKPIDVCLNFHVENTLFQYIRTYDIAYSKFNTGYTDLMKQIEWCIENKVKSISFSKGDFYWKRRWCNTVYDYDYEVFYNVRSIKAILAVNRFRLIKSSIQLLREMNVIKMYHYFKDKRRLANRPEPTSKIELLEPNYNFDSSEMAKIDLYTKQYDEYRRLVFEFLYQSDEREKDISAYAIKNETNFFLVKGKKNNAKISF